MQLPIDDLQKAMYDEKISLAVRAAIPVDELVPLFHEGMDVLGLVVVGVANRKGVGAEILSSLGMSHVTSSIGTER